METKDINQAMGLRLKKLRSERGLTLEALSELTGVSVSMLSTIERGRKSPTLTILNKIKGGMGITLTELFDDARDSDRRLTRREEMHVVRRRDGGELWMLLDCAPNGRFEVMRQEIPPHSRWASEPHIGANLWEHCLVVRGTLTMRVEDQCFRVARDELFSFLANVEHCYENADDEALTLIVINAYQQT